MEKSFRLRRLIIGSEVIPSRPEFKRLMLTGYLALISMVTAIIYTVLDLSSGVTYSLPAYFVLFFMPGVSLWLIRSKRYQAAKILLMTSVNLVVFFTATNDPFETGVFVYFVPTGIGSFALFDFRERTVPLLLAILTLLLFLLAYWGGFRMESIERPSDFYIKTSFIFNYLVSLTIAVLIVYFLISLNQESENELIDKERIAVVKNEELQKVNEELDRFVYSVSHDLRSPLSSILGLTDLALRSNSKEEIGEYIGMIQGRVKAQDHFIREIIDYSRNARTEISKDIVSLKAFVDEIFLLLKYNVGGERIEFKNTISNDLQILTDRRRLTTIVSNLVSNAIKYHDDGRDNPFVEIGYLKDRSTLYVKDNGTGIKLQYQKKLFNMFYRASDKSSGSGLGLFITKETIEKMNGSIRVESVFGEGSTFYVSLSEKQHKA